VTPALRAAWRRVMPRGLSLADGWVVRLAPELAFDRGEQRLLVALQWGAGRLRASGADPQAGDASSGWRVALSWRWRGAGPASAPEPSAGGGR
jgi:hypothetical protein